MFHVEQRGSALPKRGPAGGTFHVEQRENALPKRGTAGGTFHVEQKKESATPGAPAEQEETRGTGREERAWSADAHVRGSTRKYK